MARTTRSNKAAAAAKKSDDAKNEAKEQEKPKRGSIPKVAATKSETKRKTLPPATRKYQSSSIFSPKFSDLPSKFLEKIVGYLDPVSRFRAQKSCKPLRAAVKSAPYRYKVFGFQVRHYLIMEVNGRLVYYEKDPDSANGCIQKYGGEEKTFRNVNHVDMAIDDLVPILENPGFSTDKMIVVLYERDPKIFSRCVGLLPDAAATRNSKFDVGHLEMYAYVMNDLVESLMTMKPGTLETIELHCMNWELDREHEIHKLNRIYATDQFQQAKRVEISGGVVGLNHIQQHFLRFKHFAVELDHLKPADVVRVRDLLTTSTAFHSCRLTIWNKLDPLAICDVLGVQYDALQAKIDASSANHCASSGSKKKTRMAQKLKELEIVEHKWKVPGGGKKKDFLQIKVAISNRKRGKDGELVWAPRKLTLEIQKM